MIKGIKNLDEKKTITLEDARQGLFNALRQDDPKEQEEAFNNFTAALQSDIMNEARYTMRQIEEGKADEKILEARGTITPLTSTEKKYFNAVIERGGFENVDELFPTTIIQDVFSKIKTEHPILSKIDSKYVGAMLEYIFAKPNTAKAFWGPICEDIKQMILAGFEHVDLGSSRLSGFVAVCKGMLELGPNWLARYVIELMYEIMAVELEEAVINGDGNNKPIGMMRKLSRAVDSVYPEKSPITLSDLSAKSLAGIRAALAKAKLDDAGTVLIVNPVSYWSKIFPNTVFQTDNGTWVSDRLATGEEILKSYAVPEDKLIIGNPSNYFLGISGDVRIDEYDQTLAIEDMQLYIAKFFGYGIPKDPNAFFVADIATVEGATIPELETVEEIPGA